MSFVCAFSDGIYNCFQLQLELPGGKLDLEQPRTVTPELKLLGNSASGLLWAILAVVEGKKPQTE